jgi:hypothetical protein
VNKQKEIPDNMYKISFGIPKYSSNGSNIPSKNAVVSNAPIASNKKAFFKPKFLKISMMIFISL